MIAGTSPLPVSRSFPLLVIAVLAIVVFVPGCISLQPTGGSPPGGPADPSLQVSFVSQDSSWSFARGCSWTVEYQVSNTGEREIRNIRVDISLASAENGAVRDTRDIFIGTLAPGSSRTVVAELDGECLNEYTVRAAAYSGT